MAQCRLLISTYCMNIYIYIYIHSIYIYTWYNIWIACSCWIAYPSSEDQQVGTTEMDWNGNCVIFGRNLCAIPLDHFPLPFFGEVPYLSLSCHSKIPGSLWILRQWPGPQLIGVGGGPLGSRQMGHAKRSKDYWMPTQWPNGIQCFYSALY